MADDSNRFKRMFLSPSLVSKDEYQAAIALATETVIKQFGDLQTPYSGKTVPELRELQEVLNLDTQYGNELSRVLNQVGSIVVQNSVNVNNPLCIAHLHCPPLIASLAAEVIISATNQSLDSWDQSPSATLIEQMLVKHMCRLFRLGENSDGIFTSGGTQSNFMGLLLARDYAVSTNPYWDVRKNGLPVDAGNFRIICSSLSHFSVRQSARILGLGEDSIITLDVNRDKRLSPNKVRDAIGTLIDNGMSPIALVATAGTTDFGSIDPLIELADVAKEHNLWMHVDASVGGGLIFSNKHKHLLDGIECADSISIDFHKLYFQPISCGLFLLNNAENFELIRLNADYLNPETNEEDGIPDLVTKSIQTTRRFDALKMLVSILTYGENSFGNLVDTLINTAIGFSRIIKKTKDFELKASPQLNSVVFRFLPSSSDIDKDRKYIDSTNQQIRNALMTEGSAVIGFTRFEGSYWLKVTLMNPMTTEAQLIDLLESIRSIAYDIM